MKALYYQGNKSFAIQDADIIPLQAGEVRLKVAYCGVCGTDVHIYHGNMDQRVRIPQVIGHEVSAEIAEVGVGVTDWQVGDRVAVRPLQPGANHPSDFGQNHIGKNLKFIGIDTTGGMQQYWNVPAHTLHRLPDSLSLEIGALIEPLAVACHDIRLGELQAGESVVVIGGGPIGILIALVAKHKGGRVLVSEVNPNRIALAQSLGLTAINPLEKDMVHEVEVFTEGTMADLVLEVSGVQAGVDVMTQLPRARGRIVMVAIHAQAKSVDLFRFFWRELRRWIVSDVKLCINGVADVIIKLSDLLLCDIDGVLAVLRDIAYEVLLRAEEIKENEKLIFGWVKDGKSVQSIT